jgi:hypothetical protein
MPVEHLGEAVRSKERHDQRAAVASSHAKLLKEDTPLIVSAKLCAFASLRETSKTWFRQDAKDAKKDKCRVSWRSWRLGEKRLSLGFFPSPRKSEIPPPIVFARNLSYAARAMGWQGRFQGSAHLFAFAGVIGFEQYSAAPSRAQVAAS